MSDFLFSEAIVEEDGSLIDESEDEIETVSDNDFINNTETDESVELSSVLLLMLIEIMPTLFMILFLILILTKNRIITVIKMKFAIYLLMNLKTINKKLIFLLAR